MLRLVTSLRLPPLAATLALVGLVWVPALGCKSKEGQVCRCAADCRDGLLCVVGDSEVLGEGECTINLEIGYCVADESLPDEAGGLGDMPIFDDMPSKRDLPDGGDEDTGTGTGTGDGDGDLTTTGDGDGDLTTTGDGDGDLTTTGDGDGDLTTGDGDGDLTTGGP